MRKTMVFAKRSMKELLRDPLGLVFSVGLPLALLFIMSAIRRSTGADIFRMEDFGPATAVFGQTFIAMFTGILVAQDRGSAYLMRLFASPLTAWNFILGYSLPLIPLSMMQGAICLGASAALGLELNGNFFAALGCLLPSAVLFVALGILLGCLLKETQVGGVASILVQLMAFTSGMWFDLKQVGGAFLNVSKALPFMYAVDAVRNAAAGETAALLPAVIVVGVWAVVCFALAAGVFHKKRKSDKN